jgi:hypothetical protein
MISTVVSKRNIVSLKKLDITVLFMLQQKLSKIPKIKSEKPNG